LIFASIQRLIFSSDDTSSSISLLISIVETLFHEIIPMHHIVKIPLVLDNIAKLHTQIIEDITDIAECFINMHNCFHYFCFQFIFGHAGTEQGEYLLLVQ
jgi:hypothetical protein